MIRVGHLAGAILATVLPSAALAQPAVTDDDDRAAIIATLERAFEGVATRDPAIWREVLLEAGNAISFRPAEQDGWAMRLVGNAEMVAGMTPDSRRLLERFTAEPTVLIRGPIAVLWGEYDFWIDDEFSHCGIDAADLVKIDDRWMIANLMWTAESEGCPTAAGPTPDMP